MSIAFDNLNLHVSPGGLEVVDVTPAVGEDPGNPVVEEPACGVVVEEPSMGGLVPPVPEMVKIHG